MKSNQLFKFTLSCITGICLVSRMGHAQSDAAAVREAYGKLPLSFEANRGQMVRADAGAATNARGQSDDARPSMRGQEAIKELKRTGGYESLMEAMQAVYQKDGQAEDLFAPDATQQQKLTASDGAAGDLFGHSVAISGDTAIVGALSDDTTGGTNAGSAYVFTRSGTVWTQQQKLTASDGAAGDQFGFSVAISGDTAIIGANGDDTTGGTDTGSAYVFTRSGTVWTQQQRLLASDIATNDDFGFSVAISGDTAIVGSLGNSSPFVQGAGSAYVFTRSGTVWTQQQKLTASGGATDDGFGVSVVISGDTAIVGAPADDTTGGTNAGSAYVFTRSGTVWTQQQKLTASDGAAGDGFGASVAISGDTAIVGAVIDDTTGGTDAGSAYVLTRSGTVWTQQQKLTASDGAAGDSFGRSVAINGDTAIVGATGDYPLSADTGWAYVFTRSGTVWTQQQKLTASDGEAGDQFGFSVAISGDTFIVGAYFDDTTGGMDAGSAYIFAGNAPTSQLLNISTRMQVLTDPNQLIGGFIVTGSEPKRVIILATGPSLAAFGIPGVLANPTLELFQDNTLVASNDDWKIPAQAEIEATGLQPTNDLESALVRTLAPGAYTAIVRGTSGGTGVGTVQVFDLAQTANSKLANISSRGFVDTGANVMIAGFILGGANGATNSRVLIRAIGPSLNPFLSGALQDPTLELKDANGSTLRSNDDWKVDGQQAEIEAAGLAPTDDRESALVTSLPSGSFTATVRGKSGATGVAVVQVYNVP